MLVLLQMSRAILAPSLASANYLLPLITDKGCWAVMVVEGFLSVSAEDTQLVECYKTTLKMKWVEDPEPIIPQ